MENKYIDLIINKCMDLNRSKVVFISYNKEIKDFIDKIINKLESLEVTDIYRDEIDMKERHDYLANHTVEEIENSDYFNSSIWDEYAKKNANFLMIETEIPHINDDIDPMKLSASNKRRIETKPLYREMQNKCKLLWSIIAYPSIEWSRDIFKNEINSYEKLTNAIYKACMIDSNNPIDSWNVLLDRQYKIINKLNSLNLDRLHYTNKLGTDLIIYLPDNYRYASAMDNGLLVNMPSYEVFTSPIYNKTEGIVYSSKPLIYNGSIVDEFYIKFKEGKVVEYDAKVGKDILKGIIKIDNYSCYLGEAALVEKDSPISSMNILFGTTLYDENASCHLALGAGFPECIENGLNMNKEELMSIGINDSKAHVDFMIGTNDLNIVGYTKDNKEIQIFKDGKFSKKII